MKWIELTDYVSDQVFILNIDRVDFMTRVEECTVLRIGEEDIAVNETPDTILQRIGRGTGRILND